MSWELVSETDSGYKKFRDSYENFRYMNPEGKFTNQNAWAGAFAQGDTEEIPATPKVPEGGVSEPSGPFTKTVRDDLENYEDMVDFSIDEPYENYTPPMDKSYALGMGYPLVDYPENKRVDMLKEKTEELDYENYTWGVYVVMVEEQDGTIISAGYRFTKHGDNVNILRGEFLTEIIEDLYGHLSDYGDVIITETILKGMNYE